MSPVQLAVIRSIVRRIFHSYLTVSNTFPFTHERFHCSSPHFSNTTLQNLQSISVLLSEASKFQSCTKRRSKCSILNLTFICPCIGNIILNYNQQDATFLDLFISTDALHVSGGFSAHHQEHITVHTASGTVNQYCC